MSKNKNKANVSILAELENRVWIVATTNDEAKASSWLRRASANLGKFNKDTMNRADFLSKFAKTFGDSELEKHIYRTLTSLPRYSLVIPKQAVPNIKPEEDVVSA